MDLRTHVTARWVRQLSFPSPRSIEAWGGYKLGVSRSFFILLAFTVTEFTYGTAGCDTTLHRYNTTLNYFLESPFTLPPASPPPRNTRKIKTDGTFTSHPSPTDDKISHEKSQGI